MSIHRRKRPGDDVDAYCTRCKRDFTHTILAMANEETPERVRCNTCGSDHRYLPERSGAAAGGAAASRTFRSGPQQQEASGPLEAAPAPAITREEIDTMDSDALVAALRDLLEAAGSMPASQIASRWEGGTLVLKPGKPGLQEKEVPIETFFRKIVTVRDRLRVLEQQVNASASLSDAEKLNLQQYITRCYGSLTTFNLLFESRDEWFVGEKKSDGS